MGLVLAELWHGRGLGAGARAAAQSLAASRAGQAEAAWSVSRNAHPAARALDAVIESQRRGLPDALVREEAARRAEAALDNLRAWLRPLEVIGAVARCWACSAPCSA